MMTFFAHAKPMPAPPALVLVSVKTGIGRSASDATATCLSVRRSSALQACALSPYYLLQRRMNGIIIDQAIVIGYVDIKVAQSTFLDGIALRDTIENVPLYMTLRYYRLLWSLITLCVRPLLLVLSLLSVTSLLLTPNLARLVVTLSILLIFTSPFTLYITLLAIALQLTLMLLIVHSSYLVPSLPPSQLLLSLEARLISSYF